MGVLFKRTKLLFAACLIFVLSFVAGVFLIPLERLVEFGEHDNANIVNWDSEAFPLTVRIDSSTFDINEIEAISRATEYWNDAVGFRVFVVEITNLEPYFTNNQLTSISSEEVYFRQGDLGLSDEGGIILGYTFIQRQIFSFRMFRSNSAVVMIDEDNPIEYIFLVAVHELGHVLGLGHDSNSDSVMFRYVMESRGIILENDREYVRRQLSPMVFPEIFMEN